MAIFTGAEPVTTLSDNFSFLNNQINDSGAGFTSYAVDTGTANNLIVTLSSAPVAYEAGMMVCTTPAFSSTGPSVINVNAVGNVNIVTPAGNPLLGGEISKSQLLTMVYDGTSFRIIGSCPAILSGTFASTQVLECAGCTSALAACGFTAQPATVSLHHLGGGVPVTVRILNVSGVTGTFAIAGTNPAGGTYTSVLAVTAGGVGSISNYVSAGFTLTNGQSRIFSGQGDGSTVLVLT